MQTRGLPYPHYVCNPVQRASAIGCESLATKLNPVLANFNLKACTCGALCKNPTSNTWGNPETGNPETCTRPTQAFPSKEEGHEVGIHIVSVNDDVPLLPEPEVLPLLDRLMPGVKWPETLTSLRHMAPGEGTELAALCSMLEAELEAPAASLDQLLDSARDAIRQLLGEQHGRALAAGATRITIEAPSAPHDLRVRCRPMLGS